MEIVLLITATIDPNDFSFVGRKGFQLREIDYYDALLFYAKFNLPIVFIDNSNFSSQAIQNIFLHRKDSEYLKFESKESHKGKGHGDLEIIKFGMDNSHVLNSCEKIIKISGRFIISNIEYFVKDLRSSETIHVCNFSRNLNWADTRILLLNKDFLLHYFLPTMETYLDEENNVFFERTYARAIHLFQHHGGKIKLWSVYPYYKGINGQNGKKITLNFFKRMKYQFYFLLKRFIFDQTV